MLDKTVCGLRIIFFVALCFLLAVGYSQAAAMSTSAPYAFIVDFETGDVLLDKKSDETMAPASMSKLMTVYILLDKLKHGVLSLDDEFTVSDNAWKKGGVHTGGSTMFLKPRQKVKVEDLLYGIIVQSGNDACIVVAENVAGSEEQFVLEMNKKAEELGLIKSHFVNTTGWPHKSHLMSSRDIAKLSSLIIQEFPEYYEIFSNSEFTFNGIRQENRNPLLSVGKTKADGLKTGHTESSGFGLAASAVNEDESRRIVMVVNGLRSMRERKEETSKLIEWAMREFANTKFVAKDMTLGSLPVALGKKSLVDVVAATDVVATHPKTGKKKVKVALFYNKPLKAPIKKGDVVGKVVVSSPDFEVKQVDVLAKNDVDSLGFFGMLLEKIKYILGMGEYDNNAK